MNRVKTIVNADEIVVYSPYSSVFVSKARDIGGKWNSTKRAWVFDARLQERVSAILYSIYGHDGINLSNLVDVQLTYDDLEKVCSPFFKYGALVAAASGRDSGAKLGDGVLVLKGGFDSGGSMKYWKTKSLPNTVIILKQVPQEAIEKDENKSLYQPKILESSLPPRRIFTFKSQEDSPEKIREQFEAELTRFFQSKNQSQEQQLEKEGQVESQKQETDTLTEKVADPHS